MATESRPTWRQIRARIGGITAANPDADVTGDLRDMRVARLEEQIDRIVSAAPPPTPEQLERLRALLAPPKAA
ncbi:hypothetical protein ACFWBM_07395 [Streptomyces sp. NPDC059980]|uniref:hypothetical protein n=1 Tax=Streptomyces sp. NPDC059980 TaxID=3347022 RepID=UPI00367B0D22